MAAWAALRTLTNFGRNTLSLQMMMSLSLLPMFLSTYRRYLRLSFPDASRLLLPITDDGGQLLAWHFEPH